MSFLMGNFNFSANITACVPKRTKTLLFIAANSQYILFNSRSDLEAKATSVSSKVKGWVTGMVNVIFGVQY